MHQQTTKRLIIRPFSMTDLEDAHQLLDLDIEWSGPSFSLEQRRDRLQRYIMLSQWDEGNYLFGYRAIILKESELLIGLCGFLPSLWKPRAKALFWTQLFGQPDNPAEYAYSSFELEIGYALSSHYRSRGYATEAIMALLEYAFNTLRAKRIFAGTNRSNAGSINLMKRIGMQTVNHPERPDEEWPDGPAVVGCIENFHQG